MASQKDFVQRLKDYVRTVLTHEVLQVNQLLIYFADIDTIKIRSDEEEGSGASKARRTYNYRVSNRLFS